MRPSLICGLATLCLLHLAGCGGKPNAPVGGKTPEPGEHNHPENDIGPHGGQIVEIHDHKDGKEVEAYHAEFACDKATYTFTLYLLDLEIKNPVPVEQKEIVLKLKEKEGDAPTNFTLSAAPQAGDKDGKSSRFQLVDEKLCAIYNKKGVTGSFDVTFDKPFIVPYTAAGEEHAGKEHAGK